MKYRTLAKFCELVTSVESLQHEFSKGLELYKCKVILRDGSNLRILEKYFHDDLVYYSYYWLTAANQLFTVCEQKIICVFLGGSNAAGRIG